MRNIISAFVPAILLLLCPSVPCCTRSYPALGCSKQAPSHPGPAQCGAAVALPEQTTSIAFEPHRPPLQSTMGVPCPAKDAARDVARDWFDNEKGSYPTPEYNTFSDAFSSRRVYNSKGKKGKELIKRVVNDKKVRKAFKNAKGQAVRNAFKKAKGGKKKAPQLSKAIELWLTNPNTWERVTVAGRRYAKECNNSASTVAVGEVLQQARDYSAEGSALAAVQDGKGLYMYFELCEEGIHACQTILRAAEGKVVDPIHNVYLSWDHPDRPRQIAIEQVTYNLGLLAGESEGGSVDGILGGYSVEEVHATSFDDLKEMAFALGKEQAEDEIDADHIGALRFQALANIKITIDDIASDLEDGTCAAVPLKDGFGPYCFPTAFEASILVQNCHGGGSSRHGFDPVTESEREWITEAFRYLIDKYGADGYVIDMKAEANGKTDCDTGLNDKVPIPKEDGGGFARLLSLENPADVNGLTTFDVSLSDGDGSFVKHVHHQVLQQVLTSSGSGMKNHAEFNEFLGGKTFEEKYPFTRRDKRRYEKILEDWQKERPGIVFAEWCDVDHCVGRSKRWMNNILFTNLCSHSWNQCMAAVRIRTGDWCFGLGTKAY